MRVARSDFQRGACFLQCTLLILRIAQHTLLCSGRCAGRHGKDAGPCWVAGWGAGRGHTFEGRGWAW